MQRQAIDEYLDGALDAATQAEVEKAIALDAGAAQLLKRVKAERALRASVYKSYTPTTQESAAFAAQVLAACDDQAAQPAGRIGFTVWTRRLAGIAAAVVIAAMAFLGGRISAPQTIVERPGSVETKTVYQVVYEDASGVTQWNEFPTAELRNAYADQIEQHGASGLAYLDLATPGHI